MAIYTLGIDVGSTASKCVILKDGQEIVAKSLVSVGTGTSGPQRAIDEVLQKAGMTREEIMKIKNPLERQKMIAAHPEAFK